MKNLILSLLVLASFSMQAQSLERFGIKDVEVEQVVPPRHVSQTINVTTFHYSPKDIGHAKLKLKALLDSQDIPEHTGYKVDTHLKVWNNDKYSFSLYSSSTYVRVEIIEL